MEYASNAKANAALTTGIIGTSLGAIASAGGLAGILGVRPGAGGPMNDGDKPVTRYEMGLIQVANNKDNEITLLKSQQYTDKAMFGVQAQIGQQTAWNATQQANIGFLQNQVNDALSISRRFVPNANIAPGWGPAAVVPLPPPVLTVPPTTETTSSTTTTTGTGN